MISHVGAVIAHDGFDKIVREFHAILVMTYYAFRLDKEGKPKTKSGDCIVLREFIKTDGTVWSQVGCPLNNAVVHWHLPESWEWDDNSGEYVAGAESV